MDERGRRMFKVHERGLLGHDTNGRGRKHIITAQHIE